MEISFVDPDHHYDVAKNVFEVFPGLSWSTITNQWCLDGSPCNIHKVLAEDFAKVVVQTASLFINKASQAEDSDEQERLKEKGNTIRQLYSKLKNRGYRNKIMLEMRDVLGA